MRNKTFLITALLFVLSFNTQAQLLQIGAKVGLNYANFTGSEIQSDAITSYHAGLIAEIKLMDKFAIQPELLYTTQGASYDRAGQEFKNELGYIAIPVLAKIYLSKSFSLELGPQASFLLSEKNDFDVNNSNTFDFAVDAGLSFKITKNIFLQGRYVLGLTEVSTTAETKNSVLQFSAGLMF
ncbi:Outer membrane protein beta-barrel domain-containing protein [Flavobacterium fluvii]|uniref:Outer membrane protein beta-barrel domain-containing protein n=1 Tax=Flavobacterium fluvii TaxID=468056 RepID=A0A1M5JTY4_9FLAO|nr:porin family protein [Flavobacterium fluvii]SHG43433.1 Outer membrane protein beta-barrel domain-containing protein [Flavobacterium fluvii]